MTPLPLSGSALLTLPLTPALLATDERIGPLRERAATDDTRPAGSGKLAPAVQVFVRGDSTGDTIGQRAAVVRSFFNWAKKAGHVPFNPAEEIRVPRGSRRLREAHDLAEIRLIAGAQERIGDEAAVLVMGRLGLRKMEAARLQARDVNLAQDVLYIRDAKGGKPAALPVTFPELRQALSLWLSEPGRWIATT